jgi:Family of unknown function (DUF6812)
MPTLKTKVIILTKDFRIEGEIDLVPGARLTDFMNQTTKFMVVTNAVVNTHSNTEIFQSNFINVLVNNIEIILPADNIL